MPETEVKEMLPPYTVEEDCFRVPNERKRRKERGAPSSLGKREKKHFSGINVMGDELQQTSIFELHYSIWRTFCRLESLTQNKKKKKNRAFRNKRWGVEAKGHMY